MRKVKLNNVDLRDISVLSDELCGYVVRKGHRVAATRNMDMHLNELLLMDIAQNLYYDLGIRLYKSSKSTASISLEVNEAIVVIQVIVEADHPTDSYARFALDGFKEKLHQEIINL